VEGGEIMEYIMKPNDIVKPESVQPSPGGGCSVYYCPLDWVDGGIGSGDCTFCGSWCAYRG
jgi:hypothetical protein